MTSTDTDAREALHQLIRGFMPIHLIAAAAELRIADRLVDGPRSSVELAALAEVDPDALQRVLHALAELGVFAMLEDGRFALTPMGEYLRTDLPDSLHAVARFWGAEFHQRLFLGLPYTLRTGRTAFDHVHGMSWIAYLAANPEAAAIFNDGMTAQTAGIAEAAAAAYDFGSFGTVVDIGGGNGTTVAAILRAYSEVRGTIFDLPHSERGAKQYLSQVGLESRCAFVGGDFFQAVPEGADAYVLKWIIHDWDDERSVAILRSCRRAMTPASKLLIVERLLPTGNQSEPNAVFGNYVMLLHTGGRERTVAQYRALLEAADLRLARTIPTTTPFWILEAVPA